MKPPYETVLGTASYEACPQCQFEPGADDNPGTTSPCSFAQYREKWLQNRPKLGTGPNEYQEDVRENIYNKRQ